MASDIVLQPLASGLPALTAIVSAGDGRLFLVEQAGRVVIWNGASVQGGSFLDVSGLVSCCGERGLLSIAFHPQYASNGLFFVNYTNTAGNTVIARYQVSSNPDVADGTSGVVLLTIAQPFANHNGGQLQFGPDGYLYIGMGDGGSANDPMCNAQRDDVLLGKLLRIDVNVSAAPYYTVPADNPFRPGGVPNEVWSKGLRNPWRFSFDRLTGDLWIADVGQGAREEVDFAARASGGGAGQNYGWKAMEGTICGGGGLSGCPTSPAPPACGSAAYTAPVYEYAHGTGDCSITGGYVYRGSAMPSFAGQYFYGDYCTGKIWANGRLLTPRAATLTTFGQDASGELYLATGNGAFFRIAQTGLKGDFDSNGRTDILWRNTATGENTVWLVTPLGGVAPSALPPVFDGNWRIGAAADFDSDFNTDILWRNVVTGENVIWRMSGTTVRQQVALPPVFDLNWQIRAAADFDGDGSPDILWRNTSTGADVIWLMAGTSVASVVGIAPVPDLNWDIGAAADFDGDGKPDILWRNASNGQNTIWRMNGASVAALIPLPPVSDPAWQITGAGDFSGEGQTEILWRNTATGADTVWQMNRTVPVRAYALPAVADLNWRITGPR